MKQKFQTYCPLFPGFYNTVFESDEDNEIDSYNQENNTDYDYDNFEWDYSDYQNRISECFCNRLESELKQFLDISIEFESLYSPREYNFANDSINCTIELDLNELIKLLAEKNRKEDAEKYFKDTYTSCSGFISFHSNKIEDWLKTEYILENPKHRIGALLDCLCEIEIDKDDIIYWCDCEMYVNYSLKEEAE